MCAYSVRLLVRLLVRIFQRIVPNGNIHSCRNTRRTSDNCNQPNKIDYGSQSIFRLLEVQNIPQDISAI